jgi:hypothetical protein
MEQTRQQDEGIMAPGSINVLFRHYIRKAARSALARIDGVWHAGFVPAPPEQPDLNVASQQRVFAALRLFTPRDMVGLGKIRVGGNDDGGYVMADCLRPSQPILSLGVGPDVSFDLELAQQGHDIVMFDHTVNSLPAQHEKFTWHRLGVAASAQPSSSLRTLAELMELLPDRPDAPILKMDVEGAEWDVLANTPRETLARFTQIGLEFHDLLKLNNEEFNTLALRALQNLTLDFVPIHVHGNNCSLVGLVGGFICPDVLEVTYIRRDLVETVPSQTWYPTALDRSNWRGGCEYLLYYFPFSPGSETLELASFGA